MPWLCLQLEIAVEFAELSRAQAYEARAISMLVFEKWAARRRAGQASWTAKKRATDPAWVAKTRARSTAWRLANKARAAANLRRWRAERKARGVA